MSVSTRYVMAVAGVAAISSIILGAVIIRMGMEDQFRAWERNARTSAILASQAVDDEGPVILATVVGEESALSAAAVYSPDFEPIEAFANPGLGEVLPTPELLADLVSDAGPVQPRQIIPVPDSPGVAVVVRNDNAGYVAVAVNQEEFAEDLASLVSVGVATIVGLSALAALITALLVRRLARPLVSLARATVDLEQGHYDPKVLESGRERSDEVGMLVRRFDVMAREIQSRQEDLQRQLAALQVKIDDSERARSVERITASRSFTEIQERAQQLRRRREGLEREAGSRVHREQEADG